MENPFLKTFGRPARELACECERESDSNLSQALQLIGGATVNGKLRDDNGRMATLAKSTKTPEEITKELYLVALAREPNATEMAAAVKHLTAADRPPPGRRGPGLGPDQLQGVPVPALIGRTGIAIRHQDQLSWHWAWPLCHAPCVAIPSTAGFFTPGSSRFVARSPSSVSP